MIHRLARINRRPLQRLFCYDKDFAEKFELLPMKNIRNFSIIAHIDHGKSTIADRIIEHCTNGKLGNSQVLDRLEVEKDRGITIKAQSSSLFYQYKGEEYLINLVDTPGHADFAYEVERALKACEGALLVVDCLQGIQAQTMAHFSNAKNLKTKEKDIFGKDSNFEIIPVMNKIDLPGADPELAEVHVAITFGLEKEAVYCSAKNGIGIKELLDAIVEHIPPPTFLDWGMSKDLSSVDQFRAFVFDSWFELNRGVYLLIRVFNGSVKLGDELKISKMPGRVVVVRELGVMNPNKCSIETLESGQVGYIGVSLKEAKDSVHNLGSTLISPENEFSLYDFENENAIPPSNPEGEKKVSSIPELIKAKQLVYASIYPESSEEFQALKVAIDKLNLEDPALSVEVEGSPALGSGFRCGFLGSLHLDCFKQRLLAEYGLGCITTYPTVVYKAKLPGGVEEKLIYNPLEAPERCHWEEPWANTNILCKNEYAENLKKISLTRRGIVIDQKETGDGQTLLKMEFPMSEIITDFVDVLKSNSRGYASLDYSFKEFRPAEVEVVKIYITNEAIDALSFIVHKDKASAFGKKMCLKLRELIPRQLFQVAIQAKVGGKVIAAEHLKPMGKNVLARCYGGDYTRKQKLIEKQKEGKKKMRDLGKVSVPTSTLNKIFKD